MWMVCDDIVLEWKMNSEKHAWNQDKRVELEIQDQELLVVMLMVAVTVKAMSNMNLLKLLYYLGKLEFEIKEQVMEVMMVFE